jgi:GalNAc-alpha-(1->4)-GalNAc-alpha-(1->3)-diNAcBac-PP-undecaprenol alpha-1,4-N-acetyl-D-galactosaminyltransferase
MKYLCVIGAFSFGGAERVMTNIVNYLSDNNVVTFIGMREYRSPAYPINDKVKIINGLSSTNKIDNVLELRKIIKEERPDVVLSFMTQINIATIISSLGLGIPVVVSERADPSKTPAKVRRLLRKITYPFASGIVFQTEDAKAYFSKNIRKKSVIIYNPIYVSDENREYKCVKRKNEIVGIGRLDQQKNFELLIRAFKLIKDKIPGFVVKIYGEGPKREELEKLILDEGLVDRVILCGQSKTLHNDIRDASLYVLSSDFEGMPNALMESLALGIPCIATDCPVGGPRILVQNGINGLLVSVGDCVKLSAAMEQVLTDIDLAHKLSINGRNSIQKFDPKVILKQWEDYLSSKVN